MDNQLENAVADHQIHNGDLWRLKTSPNAA